MEDLEAAVEGHLFWQSALKQKLYREETAAGFMLIVPTCKFFLFQNFANLEERETACDPCCGFGS